MIPIPAANASEWTGPTGNTTYLFPASPSVLIDAGVGHRAHIDAIEAALSGRDLDLLLVTHSHSDHTAGVPALTRRWPRLIVRGGPGEPLEDGARFRSGATRLRALYTPGHAPDHFCFVDEGTHDVYCGDLLRLGGTVVIPASRGGRLADYLDSLRCVRALQPARLLPAHGPVIEDPLALIDEYLRHRELRDRQVLEALSNGCSTVDDIVARIYPGLSAALTAAAAETVRAHLAKLTDEGRCYSPPR